LLRKRFLKCNFIPWLWNKLCTKVVLFSFIIRTEYSIIAQNIDMGNILSKCNPI
jgi:hypothetical protein